MQNRMNDLEAFIQELKRYRRQLDRQTLMTLRGQALKGDVKGAQRGLDRVLRQGYRKYGLELSDTC